MSDDRSWKANAKIMHVASSEHVLGAFKTPSLRDVARTAPYAHDGRFDSLREVIDFYSDLPGTSANGHREETLKPLRLTEVEAKALIAFLESLTGAPVLAPRKSVGPRTSNAASPVVQGWVTGAQRE